MNCFLDLDGVLADFTGPVCDLFGFDRAAWPAGVYSLEQVLGVPTDDLWKRIEAEGVAFWLDLPLLDGAKALVSHAKHLFGDVCVLSGPSRCPKCYAGKKQWMDRHFPGLPLLLVPSKHKWLLASGSVWRGSRERQRLLIDDHSDNCCEWINAGGHAITFPQPWNDRHAHSAVGLGKVAVEMEAFAQ